MGICYWLPYCSPTWSSMKRCLLSAIPFWEVVSRASLSARSWLYCKSPNRMLQLVCWQYLPLFRFFFEGSRKSSHNQSAPDTGYTSVLRWPDLLVFLFTFSWAKLYFPSYCDYFNILPSGHCCMASRKAARIHPRPPPWYHVSSSRYAVSESFLSLLFDSPAELKELIAMHPEIPPHGGDLQSDTVTIIGATLDLQEKVVRQVSISLWGDDIRFDIRLNLGNDSHWECFHVKHRCQAWLRNFEDYLPYWTFSNSGLRKGRDQYAFLWRLWQGQWYT